jgi:hypothetical protein
MARYDYDKQVSHLNFRSNSLAEKAREVFPESCHTPHSESVISAFQKLLNARHSLPKAELPPEERIEAELHRQGSVLVVDWSKSLFDGAITPETDGFIDDDCMPGWDSWISLAQVPSSYGKACLICWVPDNLTRKVNFGIEVDAASCMSWLNVQRDRVRLTGWGESFA